MRKPGSRAQTSFKPAKPSDDKEGLIWAGEGLSSTRNQGVPPPLSGCAPDILKADSSRSATQGFSAGCSLLSLGCGVSVGQFASTWTQDTIHCTGGNGLSQNSDELQGYRMLGSS